MLNACGSDWVQVRNVSAATRASNTIEVDYGMCWSHAGEMPKALVVESATTIRIATMIHEPSGGHEDCLTTELIALANPIGDRVVIDERSGQTITVTFGG